MASSVQVVVDDCRDPDKSSRGASMSVEWEKADGIRRTVSAVVILAGCALVPLAACAGDDDEVSGTPIDTGTPPTTAEVTEPPASGEETTTTARATPATTARATTTTAPDPEVSAAGDSSSEQAAVLAAAVLYRVTEGNSFGPDLFTNVFVIERAGRYSEADHRITGWENGRVLTGAERTAIETALAPRVVTWIVHWRDVAGEHPPASLPEGQAIVTVAEPEIVGAVASVTTELFCGGMCVYLRRPRSPGVRKVTGLSRAKPKP